MNKHLLSIITPTYNRGNLLNNCFRSLEAQTDKRFEWIIVDDGSTDDTEAIAGCFSADFPIFYVKKENGGKHTALNASHDYIHGDYVLILDSDDTLTENAVEKALLAWDQYQVYPTVGVVIFLRGKTTEDPLAYAKDEGVPVDILRYRRVCVHSSDCCEVIRSDLFLKYPFPVFEGERFMSEGVLWNRVARTHKCVYVNEVIYLCEYLEGGLTKSGRAMRIRNPLGGMLNSQILMQRKNFLRSRIKSGLLFVCYGFFAGLGPVGLLKWGKEYRGLKVLCLLPGYGIYRIWKRRYY